MVFIDVPIKYKSSMKKTELTYIKVTCKNISGSNVKKEVSRLIFLEHNDRTLTPKINFLGV